MIAKFCTNRFNLVKYNDENSFFEEKNIIKPSYTATYLPIFPRNDENTMKNAPSLEKNL